MKKNWTKEKTITIPVRVFNELQNAYDKGFIAGSELTGRMAKESSAIEIDKARKETIEEIKQIMLDTLSGATPREHRELDEMYKKLEIL